MFKIDFGDKMANYVVNNMEDKNVEIMLKIIETMTTEERNAFNDMARRSNEFEFSSGWTKGFVIGSMAATVALSAFAYWNYKKAHKDDNKEKEQ